MFLKGSSIIDQYWGIEIESINLNADNAQIKIGIRLNQTDNPQGRRVFTLW